MRMYGAIFKTFPLIAHSYLKMDLLTCPPQNSAKTIILPQFNAIDPGLENDAETFCSIICFINYELICSIRIGNITNFVLHTCIGIP